MPSFHPLPRAIAGAPRHPRDRIVPLLLIAAAALAAPCSGAAESLSLAETLKIAVARSQQLVSQRAMADAAREMVVPAGELPDPKLKAGVENVPTDGADAWSLTRDFMTMSKIGLMQEFPGGEKRRLRVERAERDAERGAAAVVAATLAVERDAASAWYARSFAQQADARSRRRSPKRSSMSTPSPPRIALTRRRRASSLGRRAWWSSSGTGRRRPRPRQTCAHHACALRRPATRAAAG